MTLLEELNSLHKSLVKPASVSRSIKNYASYLANSHKSSVLGCGFWGNMGDGAYRGPPTNDNYEYHFDTDTGWFEVGDKFSFDYVTNNRMDIVFKRDTVLSRGLFDLQDPGGLGESLSDTAFVARWFPDNISEANSGTTNKTYTFGVCDESAGYNVGSQDALTIRGVFGQDPQYTAVESDEETLDGGTTSLFATAWTATDTYHQEIIRQSGSSSEHKLFSDAWVSLVELETLTIATTCDDLHFIGGWMRDSSLKTHTFICTYDDVFVHNGVTTPP